MADQRKRRRKRFIGFWRGAATSLDDDRTEHTPVRLAGVEQRTDPVVLEVAEPEADPLDALDQVVERFGRTVRDPGQVEVGDLVEPGPDGASEPLDLGRHDLSEIFGRNAACRVHDSAYSRGMWRQMSAPVGQTQIGQGENPVGYSVCYENTFEPVGDGLP